jgi:hypothetical protein
MKAGLKIKPIETSYNGLKFRSRLEARWAVVFDYLGIRYEYEPEGFTITDPCKENRWNYLPDFRLPEVGCWVEVKGDFGGMDDAYFEMLASAVDWGGCLPGVAESESTTRGLLLLGGIPLQNVCLLGSPLFIILQHGKGGWANWCDFNTGKLRSRPECGGVYFDSTWGSPGAAEAFRPLLVDREWYAENEPCSPKAMMAFHVARTARFEHGVSGVTL